MTLLATVFPLLCWFVYGVSVRFVERYRPSLSVIMSIQRRRWVANAAARESPLDAILSGNLMNSVSFLASTTVLLILAVVAGFGQIQAVMGSVTTMRLSGLPAYTEDEVRIHLVVMLTIFVLAFFAFTVSLRQFNHFCIMLGAIDRHSGRIDDDEIDAIARMNTLAAKNFNNGLRAQYFSIASVAWFADDWLGIAASLVTIVFLVHREFFSTAHRIAASATVLAVRHDRKAE